MIALTASWKALGIVVGAYISEDAALVSAASLAASKMLSTDVAFTAAVFGICSGDVALYAIAKRWAGTVMGRRITSRADVGALHRATRALSRWQTPALAVSRLVPGTRLPMTIAAGLNGMPFLRFASVSLLCSALWSIAVFRGLASLHRSPHFLQYVALAIVAPLLAGWLKSQAQRLARRLSRWEFWPAWLFYAPVALMYLKLACRYGGLLLPTVANLNQRNGGIVGESKLELLKQLAVADPGAVAASYAVPELPLEQRNKYLRSLVESADITFPFVLKPDVAQRGAGFRILRSWSDMCAYLERVTAPVVLQPYVAAPGEAGVFYYRLPNSGRGQILAITDKVFPFVVGNGKSTLEQLISRHPRAEFAGDAYRRRWASALHQVVPDGEAVRLVEAGNHCQGCEFRDGMHLYSAELHERIDQISRAIPGFYIGRYDLRYESAEALRRGQFTVIELNGAGSEATSLYDARNTLLEAYRTLYRQWDLVFQIGAENRKRGATPVRLRTLLGDWMNYQKLSSQYPQAS